MSHAKEIRNKKELQARLQLSVDNTTSLVSSWLKPASNNNVSSSFSVEKDISKDDFFNLPIIGGSAGLSLSSVDSYGDSSQINTIGDYVKTGKSLSSLSDKKKNLKNKHSSNVMKPVANQLRALNALKNKIRHSNIQKQKQGYSNSPTSRSHEANWKSNVDSDSDDEVDRKSAQKKSFGLLIDSKIKNRKK